MRAECLTQPSAEAGIRTRLLLASPFTPYQTSLRKEGPISHLHSSVNKRLGHSVFFIHLFSKCVCTCHGPDVAWVLQTPHTGFSSPPHTVPMRHSSPCWRRKPSLGTVKGWRHGHTAEPRFTGSFRKHPPHCCSVPRWEPGARP